MKRQMKKILAGFNILLAAGSTKLSGYFRATIEAIGFGPVFFVAHEVR